MERPTTNDARLSDEIQRWLADEARPTGRRECDPRGERKHRGR